jgi:hypothetical protein
MILHSSDDLEQFNKPDSEVLSHFRNKLGDRWEGLLHESVYRYKLSHFPDMTNELMNSFIVSMLGAKIKRNNIVAPLIPIDDHGKPKCVICSTVPVVKAMALVANRDPLPGNEDVSLVFFICKNHAEDPEGTQKEINDNDLFPQLLELRKEARDRI